MKYFFTIGGIQRNKMTLTNKGGERFPRSGSVPYIYIIDSLFSPNWSLEFHGPACRAD